MSEKSSDSLPMIGSHPLDDETASCSPKVYVSNEEKAILDAMRRLREQAEALRARLRSLDDAGERENIERRLAELRDERAALAARREQAYHRKMIMLGHIPPDDPRLF